MLIVFLVAIIVVWLIISAAVLLGVEKIFKLNDISYKRSLLVVLTYTVVTLLVVVFLEFLFGQGLLCAVLEIVCGVTVFHYILKKFHKSTWSKSLKVFVVNGVVVFFLSFLIILPMRLFIFEPFIMRGSAMSPTYENGDHLFINKTGCEYKRGDVVVFKYPKDPSKYVLKRIVGLPGETLTIENGSVYITDGNIDTSILVEELYVINAKTDKIDNEIVKLSNKEYYLMGDNRISSLDSRSFGPVKESAFVGKIINISDLQ